MDVPMFSESKVAICRADGDRGRTGVFGLRAES